MQRNSATATATVILQVRSCVPFPWALSKDLYAWQCADLSLIFQKITFMHPSQHCVLGDQGRRKQPQPHHCFGVLAESRGSGQQQPGPRWAQGKHWEEMGDTSGETTSAAAESTMVWSFDLGTKSEPAVL